MYAIRNINSTSEFLRCFSNPKRIKKTGGAMILLANKNINLDLKSTNFFLCAEDVH
jgi:hypothetical protein